MIQRPLLWVEVGKSACVLVRICESRLSLPARLSRVGAEACAKPALDASSCAGGRSQAFASAQRRAPLWRPAWHAPRPLARQSKKRNKQFHHLNSSPYSSLLHSLSHRRRDPPSPKGPVIKTSAISVRQARLCVVSGAFSV